MQRHGLNSSRLEYADATMNKSLLFFSSIVDTISDVFLPRNVSENQKENPWKILSPRQLTSFPTAQRRSWSCRAASWGWLLEISRFSPRGVCESVPIYIYICIYVDVCMCVYIYRSWISMCIYCVYVYPRVIIIVIKHP